MIVLYQFPASGGLPNLSPFCLKLETWLRMAGLTYEVKDVVNPRTAPLGKLPMVGIDGKRVADSTLAMEALIARSGIDPDRHLSAREKATALAFKLLFEDHFYWALLYSRWVDPDYWPATRDAFFGGLPGPLKKIVPAVARRSMVAELQGHGMGRHPAEQIHAFAEQDLAAVASWLGDNPFFMGQQPGTIDAVAYGFLAQVTLARLPSPLRATVDSFPALRAYCERMRARYFP